MSEEGPPAIVIFRVYEREIIALMPAESADVNGRYCTCYVHLGQHGQASYRHIMDHSRAATVLEYGALYKELVSVGYDNIEIRQRYVKRRRK